jgi:hypothetical protein
MAEHHVTHGLSRKGKHHPLYDVWEQIKSRCYIPGSTHYARYGGRGVTPQNALAKRFRQSASYFNRLAKRLTAEVT